MAPVLPSAGSGVCLHLAVGLVLVGSALPGRADQGSGLVAHYTFDEGPGGAVKDYSGHGNDGKNHGARYFSMGPGRGYALAFETPEAHVDCGQDAGLDLTKTLTISLWFRPETYPAKGEAGIVGKSIDSFTLALGKKTCWAYFGAPRGGRRTDCRITNMGVGAWVHIAVTFDAEAVRMYRDGKLADRAKPAVPAINRDQGSFFLRRPVIWGDQVEPVQKCMMDDVRVYNRALNEDEIISIYKSGAAEKQKDVAWFGKVRLTPHVYPAAGVLLVEADYWGLRPLPRNARIGLELRSTGDNRLLQRTTIPVAPPEEPQYVHTTSVCPMSSVSTADKVEWRLNTDRLPATACRVRAVATDGAGRPWGTPSAVDVRLVGRPAWLTANRDVKVLNNLVVQLLRIEGPHDRPEQRYQILNPRDGWIYLRSTARGRVRITIDGAPKPRAVIVHDGVSLEPREAMRKLAAGNHTIEVHCRSGAVLQNLVVRAVPEMIFDAIGYRPCPWLKCYGPYDWDFFQRCGVMDNHNVLVERSALAENAERCRQWRKGGRKIVSASFIDSYLGRRKTLGSGAIFDFVTALSGFKDAERDGTLMSEFDAFGYPTPPRDHPVFAEAAARISSDPSFAGKVWDCYGKFMYEAAPSMTFVKALIDGGHKFAEEIYMQEQPTEKGARQYLDAMIRQRMLRYQAALPDCRKGMIAVLSYMSIPTETVNVEPNADFKVFMDMQMNLLANDPVFSELYGVMWYHCAYANPEALRWSSRLLRHYGIEGRRDMLGKDPYRLDHIRNPDFREGTRGWTLQPARPGSIAAVHVPGFGRSQGRYPRAAMGDDALLTRRSAARPNRFSQRIVNLQPGRLYSVKLLTADYDDITKPRSEKRDHLVTISLAGAKLIPRMTIREVFSRGGGSYAKPDRKQNRWITYRVVFFRPRHSQAELTISDWAGNDDPGGPIGQQLIHNFVEIEPYLED